MFDVYYLFSNKDNLESIYICSTGNYIDKPTYKTDVYFMGTILSKVLSVLIPWYETNFNPHFYEELLHNIEKMSEFNSSFSSITNNDKTVYSILYMMLYDDKQLNKDESNKNIDIFKLMKQYIDFIKICQKAREYSTYDNLCIVANTLGRKIPGYSVYNNPSQSKEFSNIKQILLDDNQYQEYFNPTIIKQQKKLFDIGTNPEKEFSSSNKLKYPLHVYQIKNIVDLIAVSLESIFRQKYVLGECKFCKNLFVTHNRKQLYCTKQIPDIKNCQEEAKLKMQLIREKTIPYVKAHKNISKKISQKCSNSSEAYLDYLELSAKLRNDMRNERITEEEYLTHITDFWEPMKGRCKKNKCKYKSNCIKFKNS